MSKINYTGWRIGSSSINGHDIATYNPPAPQAYKGKPFEPKDSIALERGLVARAVYQTYTVMASGKKIWLDTPRFLGYRLEDKDGTCWPRPRTLTEIKAHHQEVLKAIRGAEAIAHVGSLMLDSIEQQQAA